MVKVSNGSLKRTIKKICKCNVVFACLHLHVAEDIRLDTMILSFPLITAKTKQK